MSAAAGEPVLLHASPWTSGEPLRPPLPRLLWASPSPDDRMRTHGSPSGPAPPVPERQSVRCCCGCQLGGSCSRRSLYRTHLSRRLGPRSGAGIRVRSPDCRWTALLATRPVQLKASSLPRLKRARAREAERLSQTYTCTRVHSWCLNMSLSFAFVQINNHTVNSDNSSRETKIQEIKEGITLTTEQAWQARMRFSSSHSHHAPFNSSTQLSSGTSSSGGALTM